MKAKLKCLCGAEADLEDIGVSAIQLYTNLWLEMHKGCLGSVGYWMKRCGLAEARAEKLEKELANLKSPEFILTQEIIHG